MELTIDDLYILKTQWDMSMNRNSGWVNKTFLFVYNHNCKQKLQK